MARAPEKKVSFSPFSASAFSYINKDIFSLAWPVSRANIGLGSVATEISKIFYGLVYSGVIYILNVCKTCFI